MRPIRISHVENGAGTERPRNNGIRPRDVRRHFASVLNPALREKWETCYACHTYCTNKTALWKHGAGRRLVCAMFGCSFPCRVRAWPARHTVKRPTACELCAAVSRGFLEAHGQKALRRRGRRVLVVHGRRVVSRSMFGNRDRDGFRPDTTR